MTSGRGRLNVTEIQLLLPCHYYYKDINCKKCICDRTKTYIALDIRWRHQVVKESNCWFY